MSDFKSRTFRMDSDDEIPNFNVPSNRRDLMAMSLSPMDANEVMGFGDLPTPVSDSSQVSQDCLPKNNGLGTWKVDDRYKLVRIVGKGSYGEVVEAFDIRSSLITL